MGVRANAQPTPNGPVYDGIPGALPRGFVYRYDNLSRGWPVLPRNSQHPIRGSFIDPRGTDDNGLSGYHFGIDINVDDRRPDRGASRGLSHRVYALDAGVATMPANIGARRCVNRRLDVGHFSYWHVSPIVPAGAHIRAISPDGTRIAYSSAAGGQYEIYVANIDGSGRTQLTHELLPAGHPTWSPDVVRRPRRTDGRRMARGLAVAREGVRRPRQCD